MSAIILLTLLLACNSQAQKIQVVTGVVSSTIDTYPYDSTSLLQFDFHGFSTPQRISPDILHTCEGDAIQCHLATEFHQILSKFYDAIRHEYNEVVEGHSPTTLNTPDDSTSEYRRQFPPHVGYSHYDVPDNPLPHYNDSSLHVRRPRSVPTNFSELEPFMDSSSTHFHRVRKSLDFIGDFAHYCCSIATNNDFNTLRSTTMELKSYSDSIKGSVTSNHNDILQTNNRISAIALQYQKSMTIFFRYARSLRVNLEALTKFRPLDTLFHHFYEMLYLQQHLHLTQHSYDAIDMCAQMNRLPRRVVSEEALFLELTRLEATLKPFLRKLAIPIHEINIYFTSPIVSCTVERTNISNVHIYVRVPTINLNSEFFVKELTPIPFHSDGKTCTLHEIPSFVLSTSNFTRPLSPRLVSHCSPHQSKLCFLPDLSTTSTNDPCLDHLVKGSVDSVNPCKYTCTDTADLQVTTISPNVFAITNPPRNSHIKCGEKDQILLSNSTSYGAILLEIHCHCSIFLPDERYVIPPSYPCAERDLPVMQSHIIPSQ
jgi:hypothetical protein